MQLGWNPVVVIEYTFTFKQYIEQHNKTEYREENIHNKTNIWIQIHNLEN